MFFFHSDFLNTLRKSKRVEVGMKEKQLSLNQTYITTNLQPTYSIPSTNTKQKTYQPTTSQLTTYIPTYNIFSESLDWYRYFYQLMKIEICALLGLNKLKSK